MKRIPLAIALAALLALTAAVQAQQKSQEETFASRYKGNKHNKDYINPEAGSPAISRYNGERYETEVPDTLDIAERAKLAIHGLTGPLDPEDDYTLYWLVSYNPQWMKKETWCNIRAKFMEALPLLRIATGSAENAHIDQVWMDTLVKSIGPDGLIYQANRNNNTWSSLSACGLGRLMGAEMIYYQRDGNLFWKDHLDRIVERLEQLALEQDDWAYFYQGNYLPNQAQAKGPMPKGVWSVDGFNGRIVQELGQYYMLTGNEKAKELGAKLVKYLREHSDYYGPKGEWLLDQLDPKQYPKREKDRHFGTHSHTLLYMTDYALCAKDKELANWCRKSFEWGMNENVAIPGQCATANRIGFFVEYLNPYYPTAEICSVADMIAIGLKMSQHGIGDYWDDVDKWVRNHFAECQMTNSEWYHKSSLSKGTRPVGLEETQDKVVERNVGTFFSWATANDGSANGQGHMHCCMGNASRTLYYVWQNIMRAEGDKLCVNLLMNRASKWADLDSYIPYTGQVDLKIKQTLSEVAVRAPLWVATGDTQLKVTRNGQPANPAWDGRYVKLGPVHAKDVISITFPIRTQTVTRLVYGQPLETVVGGVVYQQLVFRGNELISITPGGKVYPYYQRQKYLGAVQKIKVERFVSDEEINW